MRHKPQRDKSWIETTMDFLKRSTFKPWLLIKNDSKVVFTSVTKMSCQELGKIMCIKNNIKQRMSLLKVVLPILFYSMKNKLEGFG